MFIKFGPPPPGPLGAMFRFFKVFLENIRRSSVIIPKLHRGFILTKKEDINPKKNSPCPWGPFLGFFWKISKVVLWFRNFEYDFWGVGGDVWRW
jgi:hypothetical protein